MPSKTKTEAAPTKTAAKTTKTTTRTATKVASASKKPLRKKAKGTVAETTDTLAPEVAAAEAGAVLIPIETAPSNYWRRVDLHMHTMASHDYEQPEKSYLDILKQAERRGLSMIAFTDHNTVNGYRNMHREISDLEMLERLNRIQPEEMGRLQEYRRLLKKIVVLPGFEFTATFGFHILGLFSPNKPFREIENVLVQLRVPSNVIDQGLTEAGATSDVLAAYRAIDEAGGISIAAHANSSNGVSMRNLNLGGQTRMAFTQDPHLHAIEFTDLDRGRRSSAMLFKGTRAEYPRIMHVLQGSDAHRLVIDLKNPHRLGVGERPTEIELPEVSFEALRNLFLSQEFDRVRIADMIEIEPSAAIIKENPAIVFHPVLSKKADKFDEILRDVCGMSNANGGYLYIGCDAKLSKKSTGVANPEVATRELSEAIAAKIQPTLTAAVITEEVNSKPVLRVQVPPSQQGNKAPYAINIEDNTSIYIYANAITRLAKRDEIVSLVKRSVEADLAQQPVQHSRPTQPASTRPERPARFDSRRDRDRDRGDRVDRSEQQAARQPRPTQERSPQNQAGHNQRSGSPTHTNTRSAQNPRVASATASNRNVANRQHSSIGGAGRMRPDSRNKRVVIDGLPEIDPALEMQELEAQFAAQDAELNTPAVTPVVVPSVDDAPVLATTQTSTTPNIPIRRPINPLEIKLDGQPRNGVQVMAMEERDNVVYFTVRDLRNNTTVRNVTMKSARDLWHYAISQYAEAPAGPPDIDWQGEKADRSILNRSQRGGKMRYDVAMRDAEGRVRVFYGVTDDGLNESWRTLVAQIIANSAENGDGDQGDINNTDADDDNRFNRITPNDVSNRASADSDEE